MRAHREAQLNRIWYEDEAPPWWLNSLVPIYRAGNCLDRWYKSRRTLEDLEGAYIIVVGNITVGGSGKTPLVARLCRILQQAGFKPGVISRGYGRKDRDLRLVSPASDPGKVGDEPLLIARQTGVPVIVSPNRCKAVEKLIGMGRDVVISDDGLQHYRLPRDMEICVVDGQRKFGNGKLLPAGPLREPLSRLHSVDYVVVNGEGSILPEVEDVTPMSLHGSILSSLKDGQNWRLSQFAGCSVNAVAGIGNPERFFKLLENARIRVNRYPFPDHHAFTAEDFDPMDSNLPVLMTEKDAVKCTALGLKNAWSLAVEAALPHAWESAFIQRVCEETA